ncbi:murein hydrolase activator EnvC [Rodentibacter sp. Ppn85]|uniref:murein hydrolase activator EnvC n=1 Tax=Rodentibacter sp. Ppn85 TaxID=1908525 RepID=UPI001E2ECAC0|nr:murein hydrolase activator EnvC [Rodentibacter sp. Ppn85]
MTKTFSKSTALLVACGLIGFSSAGYGNGNDFNQIQQQIKQQESKLAKQKREQAKLQSTLKNQESKINAVAGELRETELNLKEIRKQISEADKQIKLLEKQEKEQKAKLAKQIDVIYRSGLNPSVLERMLSEDAKKAARMKVYYEHLNQVRIEMITNIQATQGQIIKQKEVILGQQQNHQNQLFTQKKQQQELEKIQRKRQSTLNEINKNINKEQDRLASLRANERALKQEIQRAEQAARQQEQREREALAQRKQAEEKRTAKPYTPTAQERQLINSTNGLGAANRQYNKPVNGSTLYTFGSTQAGEVRWKGMVIAASNGTPVRAIANGRVILAGQLTGYGYMVIIKHGDSDLSLYGFNQAVFVKPNQLVSAGQTIAQVGNTGEISRPALYFGISRKGVPVNPARWIK